MLRLCVAGGDLRQVYLALKLRDFGYSVSAFGLEKAGLLPQEMLMSAVSAVLHADGLLLPMPLFKNECFHAPFALSNIELNALVRSFYGKHIFAGMIPFSFKKEWEQSFFVYDYLEEETLTLQNAYLTAEGAVGKLLSAMPTSLFGRRILITGFGRITKYLILLLKGFQVQICVAARKEEDLENARLLGCESIRVCEIVNFSGFDALINTVPVKLFPSKLLQSLNVPYLELAHFESIDNANYYPLPGIPGNKYPLNAGEILARFVANKLAEVENE